MVRAYLGAVLAGVIALNLTFLFLLIATDLAATEGNLSLEILKQTMIHNGIIAAFSLAYSIPITALIAAPFTLICTLIMGIAWNPSHRTAVILGTACPVFSTILCALIIGLLSVGLNGLETKPFMMYFLIAIALGAAAIPSGAIAGSVFWRVGLRPGASTRVCGAKL